MSSTTGGACGTAASVPKVDGYDTSFKFGQSFDATEGGRAAMVAADLELGANSEKPVGVDGSDVADCEIGAGAAVSAGHVWVDCRAGVRPEDVTRRACLADQAGRTPQVGDDVAVTGFGGGAWYLVWNTLRRVAARSPDAAVPTAVGEAATVCTKTKENTEKNICARRRTGEQENTTN